MRNLAPASTWEERTSTSIEKTVVFLEQKGDGFVAFVDSQPASGEAFLVKDAGDNFWHLTDSPGSEDTATPVEVSGFVHLLG